MPVIVNMKNKKGFACAGLPLAVRIQMNHHIFLQTVMKPLVNAFGRRSASLLSNR